MNPTSGYDAVVFDMDGVLIERSPAWVFEEATQETFDAFGIEPGEDEYDLLRYAAWESTDWTDRFEECYGVTVESLWAVRQSLAAVNQVRAIERGEKRLYDDALSTVETVDAPTAVVSNNSQQAVEYVLRWSGFSDRLDRWYGLQPTPADAKRGKPDPTYLDRVLSDLSAETAVYVGDRASDVAAAQAAGVDSAFVHREFNAAETFENSPTYELDRLDDLPSILS